MTRTPMVLVASLVALAALVTVPASEGTLQARSMLHLGAGASMGRVGLYDPGSPSAMTIWCMDFSGSYSGTVPMDLYYAGPRYWAPGAGGPLPANLYVPEVTDCLWAVPNDHLGIEDVSAQAGGAFQSWNLLGPTETADLAQTTVRVEYCLAPTTVSAYPPGVQTGPVGGFLAESAACATPWAGSHQLFPGCSSWPMSTAPGRLDGDRPTFLEDVGACDSLLGAPAGADFLVRHCVRAVLIDTSLGVLSGTFVDQDHLIVAAEGNLAGWVLHPGTPPGGLFPNVSNLADSGAPTSAC